VVVRSGSVQSLAGQESWLLIACDLLTGASPPDEFFGPVTTRFDVVPAISLTSSSTECAAYNDSCSTTTPCSTGAPAMRVVARSWVPPSTVVWNDTDPGILATTGLPPADQSTSPASIATNDDRFLSVTFFASTLDVSGKDDCIPASDSWLRPCARLIAVATGSPSTVSVDEELGYNGGSLYYSAVVGEGNGNVLMAATLPSPPARRPCRESPSIRVVVPASPSGQISVNNQHHSTDVVVDVNGYFTDRSSTPLGSSLFTPITPIRVLATRFSAPTLGPGATGTEAMAEVARIGAHATELVTNVTATDTTAPSYLAVYPGGSRLFASDVNRGGARTTVPNLTLATVGSGGAISIHNQLGSVDVDVDASGYFSLG